MSILVSVAQIKQNCFDSGSSKLNTKFFSWPIILIGIAVICAIIVGAFLFTRGNGKGTAFMQKSGGATEKLLFRPTNDDIIDDVSSGLKIIKNVINVHFSNGASSSTISKIIESVNGKTVGYDKAVSLYQIRFADADLATIDKIRMQLLRNFKEVEAATRCSVSVHENPYYVK